MILVSDNINQHKKLTTILRCLIQIFSCMHLLRSERFFMDVVRDGLTVHPKLRKEVENLNKDEIRGRDMCKTANNGITGTEFSALGHMSI